jgi:hypothetical protein|nr:MAG TPA: hypothetical protein [Caudoviricetes sp.]
MDKEKIIEILEDYEFFVDDDFGGHYEHINCSQKALTPLGIVEILDYISELEQQVKNQKEVIDMFLEKVDKNKKLLNNPELLDLYLKIKEVSE